MVWLCFASFQEHNTTFSDNTTLNWSSAINYIYITLQQSLQAHLSSLHKTPVENHLSTHAVRLACFPARVSSNTTNEPWRVWNEREKQFMASPWGLKAHPTLSGRESPPTNPAVKWAPQIICKTTADWGADLRESKAWEERGWGLDGETETRGLKKESKDGSASCLLGVYGPWTEAGEPEHMEAICLCGLIRTWRDGASGPWRKMLQAEHVPGIRGPQSVLLNSSPGLRKPHKHILKDTRLQHKHVRLNRSTWKIWSQKANMQWNAGCSSKWIPTSDQDRKWLFVYVP